jgi:hypothetical protein
MKTERRSGKRLIGLMLVLLPAVSCDQSGPPATYDSIEGIFKCQESSPHAGVRNYLVEIDGVKDAGGLYIISNFHNKGENEFLYAELSDDTLRIQNQPISDITVNGKGPVGTDFRTIHLNYVTDDGITILDYYATYSR